MYACRYEVAPLPEQWRLEMTIFSKLAIGAGIALVVAGTGIGLGGLLEQAGIPLGRELAQANTSNPNVAWQLLGAGFVALFFGLLLRPNKEIPESEYRGRRPYDGDESSSEE